METNMIGLPNMKTKQKRDGPETLREWLDRRNLTVDQFVHGLPAHNGKPCLSTSSVNKLLMKDNRERHLRPATALLVKSKYPDCPIAQ